MKRILLSGTMFLAALSAMNAVEPVKDPATYLPVEDTYFKSLWIYSPKTNNANPLMNTTNTRGIACVDDKVYLPMRGAESHQINEFDGNTGVLTKTYTLPVTVNGNKPGLALNDLQADSQGNLAGCNLATDIQVGNFYVWRMKKGAYDKPEELLAWTMGPMGQDPLRIDFFDVYGDVYGNGCIFAAIAGKIEGYSNMVLKWTITNGVVATDPQLILINEYVPAKTLTSSIAPRVKAISDESFYLDGSDSHPTLYTINGDEGVKVEGFNTAGVCTKTTNANGIDEFELGGRLFLAAAANNHGTTVPGLPQNSAQLFDITGGMEQAKDIRVFPKDGLGSVTPAAPSINPVVKVIDENNANIYVHGCSNGVAAYRFSLQPLSIDKEKMSAMNIHLAGSELVFSEEAAKVDVYAVAGNCVAQFANVNRANLSLVKGIYIVKAMDMAGKTKVQKIVVE